MTAEERADVLMEQMPFQLGHLGYNYRQALVLAIKEAMREASLPAVPDVDIAALLQNARRKAIGVDIMARSAGHESVSPNIVTKLADALEREYTARKVLADGLKAALMHFDPDDYEEFGDVRLNAAPNWHINRVAIRKALSLIQEKV